MNIHTAIGRPAPVKLTVEDFLLLRRSGAFEGFSKAELLEGELSGVPVQAEDEPESDESIAIKLRVHDYLLLDKAGGLEKHGKTELINGVIYSMSPQHAEHFTLKVRLLRRLADACDALGQGLEAWSEGSIDMPPHSVPMPDIFVTNETPRKGLTRLETVVLAIEVASTTLRFDLGEKATLYAAQGVPEYWVVDVEGGVVHQMWEPQGGTYSERREVAFGQRMEAAIIPRLTVETSGL